MSAELALQRAIYQALTSDPTLALLLAPDPEGGSPTIPAVYDHVPQVAESENSTAFPYVVIGEHTTVNADTDDTSGQEAVLVLHVWDQRQGRARAKQVIAAIYDVLHDRALDVEGQSAIYCFWEFGESVPDENLLIQHEVTRFRVFTQEA